MHTVAHYQKEFAPPETVLSFSLELIADARKDVMSLPESVVTNDFYAWV
jgi:hypothetical protein